MENQTPEKTKRGIYAILDHKAMDLVGGPGALMIHRHPAAAVRVFDDIGSDPKSVLAKHPEDYALIRIGYLEDDSWVMEPSLEIILEGDIWAAQKQSNQVQP